MPKIGNQASSNKYVYFDTEPCQFEDKVSSSLISHKLVAVIDKQKQKQSKDNSGTFVLKLNQQQLPSAKNGDSRGKKQKILKISKSGIEKDPLLNRIDGRPGQSNDNSVEIYQDGTQQSYFRSGAKKKGTKTHSEQVS